MRVPDCLPRIRPATCVTILLLFCAAWSGAAPAAAQVVQPPGPFVIDARGAFSTVGRSDDLALPRGLQATELPRRVLGLDVGAHVYPVRGTVTLGVGASLVRLGGTQTPDTEDTAPDAPVTSGTFTLTGIAPQVSLNFGSSRGWSYVGAGLGLSRLKVGRAESTLESSPQLLTLNMGGGARWFVSEHVAFNFDLRFYRAGAKELSAEYIGNPTVSMFVVSAGLSFK
jgi:opacity protein-like surface antigen